MVLPGAPRCTSSPSGVSSDLPTVTEHHPTSVLLCFHCMDVCSVLHLAVVPQPRHQHSHMLLRSPVTHMIEHFQVLLASGEKQALVTDLWTEWQCILLKQLTIRFYVSNACSQRSPWLRAFVLGVNDGLVSVAALVGLFNNHTLNHTE